MPIRLKMTNDQTYYKSRRVSLFSSQLLSQDIEKLLHYDHGITHKDMKFILHILMYDQDNPKYQNVLQLGLEKLSKYVIKYLSTPIECKLINLYRSKAEPRINARFLHFCLKRYASSHGISLKPLHKEAATLLTQLGYFEMAKFHNAQLKKINDHEQFRKEFPRNYKTKIRTEYKDRVYPGAWG